MIINRFCYVLLFVPLVLYSSVLIASIEEKAFLHAAANNDHTKVMALIKKGVDINVKGTRNRTAFFYAAFNNSIDVLRVLLNESALDPNISDENLTTPFNIAVKKGNIASVEIMVKHAKIDPNASDIMSNFPMIYAIREHAKSSPILCNQLIESILSHPKAKKAINSKETDSGLSVLKFAIQERVDKEIVYTLIKQGAVPPFNQMRIMYNLLLYLKDKSTFFSTIFIEKFEDVTGFCHGLASLYLYSKLQDIQGLEKYNSAWFNEIIARIAKWDGKNPDWDFKDFEVFIDFIVELQGVGKFCAEGYTALDLDNNFRNAKLDLNGNVIKRMFSIVTPLSLAELEVLLNEIVDDGKMIFILSQNHSIGLLKNGKTFFYYDSNNEKGPLGFYSINSLAKEIFNYNEKNYSAIAPLSFVVFDFFDIHCSLPIPAYYFSVDGYQNYFTNVTFDLAVATTFSVGEFQTFYYKNKAPICSSSCPLHESLFAVTAAPASINDSLVLAGKVGCMDSTAYFMSLVNIDSLASFGSNALHEASTQGHNEIAQRLINNNATIDFPNADGNTALILASTTGELDMVKLLHKNKADINYKNNSTMIFPPSLSLRNEATALTQASAHGCDGVVKYLLHNGANVNHRMLDGYGPNALSLAVSNNHDIVVEIILKHGVNQVNYNLAKSDAQKNFNKADTDHIAAVSSFEKDYSYAKKTLHEKTLNLLKTASCYSGICQIR